MYVKDDINNISIIVPLYKGTKYIENIIKMVSSNTFLLPDRVKVELLFINDYSEPIDPNVATKMLPPNLSIKFFENKDNLGIHRSRVVGVQISQGHYILFLDQDDVIYDEWLSSQFKLIEDADVIICNGVNNHKLIYADKSIHKNVLKLNGWLQGVNVIISPGQALIKKSAIPSIWLDNTLKVNGADDLFLWIILHNQNAKFKINENILYEHIWHADNTSSNRERMKQSLMELKVIVENLGMGSLENEVIKDILNRHSASVTNSSITTSIFKQWLYFSECGIKMEELLLEKNYINIAVYGLGMLGECLYHSLYSSQYIKILYGIDRRASCFRFNFPVYSPEEDIPESDVIIVTIPGDFKEIECKLRLKVDCSIISIEDLFA